MPLSSDRLLTLGGSVTPCHLISPSIPRAGSQHRLCQQRHAAAVLRGPQRELGANAAEAKVGLQGRSFQTEFHHARDPGQGFDGRDPGGPYCGQHLGSCSKVVRGGSGNEVAAYCLNARDRGGFHDRRREANTASAGQSEL